MPTWKLCSPAPVGLAKNMHGHANKHKEMYRPHRWLIGVTIPCIQKLPHLYLHLPHSRHFRRQRKVKQGDGLCLFVVQYFTRWGKETFWTETRSAVLWQGSWAFDWSLRIEWKQGEELHHCSLPPMKLGKIYTYFSDIPGQFTRQKKFLQ